MVRGSVFPLTVLKLHERPKNAILLQMNGIWLTLNRLKIPNFPREISEIDTCTSFMVHEMQVTCRKPVNQYAFHFFKHPISIKCRFVS